MGREPPNHFGLENLPPPPTVCVGYPGRTSPQKLGLGVLYFDVFFVSGVLGSYYRYLYQEILCFQGLLQG